MLVGQTFAKYNVLIALCLVIKHFKWHSVWFKTFGRNNILVPQQLVKKHLDDTMFHWKGIWLKNIWPKQHFGATTIGQNTFIWHNVSQKRHLVKNIWPTQCFADTAFGQKTIGRHNVLLTQLWPHRWVAPQVGFFTVRFVKEPFGQMVLYQNTWHRFSYLDHLKEDRGNAVGTAKGPHLSGI